MASPKSWYCELCNKGPFGGPKPWNEHLNSQCHKLKDILQYTAKQNPFFCDVCNITTNSQDSLAQHLSSPRHKAAKDRAHEINCMKDNQNRRNTSDNGGSVQRTLFNRSISCNACGEVFHDHVRAEQHFSSEAHRRNAEFEERDSADLSSSLNPFDGSCRQTSSIIPQENLVSIHGNVHQTDTVTRQINFEQQMKQLDLDMEEEVPHLRRETENSPVEEYTFSGSRGYCYICNLELTSRPHADQHLNGKSHKKAKEKSGQAKMPPLLHNREQAIPALNKSTKEAISNRKEYIFDGSRGYCHVCETELTSQLQAEQHLQGHKHKKAVEKSTVNKAHQDFPPRTNGHGEQAIPNYNKPPSEVKISKPKEYTFDGLRGYCNVCDLELTSKAHAEQHLQGQKHRKAVERSSVTNVHRQGVPEIIGQVNQLQQQATQGIAPMNGKIQKDRSREYEWYGNRGWCNICDVELSSEQQKQQHLNGKNHEKNKKKGIYGAGGDRNLPLYCKVCDKQFSGPESAAMHYASAKHKQKAQLVGGEDYNMAVQGAELFHLGQDRTQWVKCEICLCLLNSEEQLEIHKRSPKHKAELEKKLRRKDQGDILYRDQHPLTQQPANEEPQLPVSHMSFKHSHIPGQRPAYPLENNSNNNSENPPPIPGTKGPQSSTDPFNLSFGLEQISQNLSQGFLINKISFGELCPEDSLNDGNSSVVQYSVAEIETTPKTAMSVVENMEKYNFLKENPNVWKEEKASSDVSLGLYSGFKEEENGNPNQDSMLSFASSSSGYSTASEGKIADCDIAGLPVQQKRSTGSDVARALKNRQRKSNARKGEGHILDEENDTLVPEADCEVSKKYEEEAAAMIRKNLEVIEENRTLGRGHHLQSEHCPQASQSRIQALHNAQQYLKHNGNDARATTKVESPFAYHKFYCSTCNRPMNTEKAYREHMRGQGHMQKVATEPALSRNHSPLLKKFEDYGNLNFDLTKTVPRGYQRELFTKAMEGDTVLFLPTGTGKTLISCMAVSAMLTQNPTRQVVFLVDKVLLVIQQSRYLINELGDRNYTRFDPDNVNSPNSHSQLMDRKLRIAALCGGQQSTGGVPLWKHDLIVVTAAFYENLLSQSVLKWTDLSLVVFDEAHHCGKNHPFNRLLQEHQLLKASSVRPKVLGLTASPAGRPTVDETLDMLKYFMANLGHAKMAIVEKNKTELESYQSNALVKVITAESSAKEESLRLQLQLYLLESYTKFCAETDMLDKYNLGLQATVKRNLTKKELIECAETLEGDLLNSLEVTLDKASPKSNNAAHRLIVANLSTHIKYVCYALNSLFEAGVPLALEELQILMAARESSGFEFAKSLGLKCDDLLAEYDSCQEVELSTTREMTGKPHLTSKINCLIKSLLSLENIDWRKREERPMALVLVKQRSTAKMVCSILQSESMVKSLGLSVVYVVGHGAGSAEGGMTVSQQKRLLEEVKAHRHQIIVATSVAEEGIDIPECQLVVSMNPPSTVTALVQMRGRARKIQSKFVIICTDVNEKAKMEDLQLKENNMTKATAIIVREQRQQR